MGIRKAVLRVPATSANIGPGFDVAGLALEINLEVWVEIDESVKSQAPLNCIIEYEGDGAKDVPLIADSNLLTQTSLYVLRCHKLRSFPSETKIRIVNPIPLGRGLGSSGAAVVAGVLLADYVGQLGMTKERMMDYTLMIERHPDNVTAAMYGGFVGSYLRDLEPADISRKEIPLSEVLPAPAGGIDTGLVPPEPPLGIGHHIQFGWANEIKAIAVIPDFEVSTASAREVLPNSYSKHDLIFNLQRLAVLTTALTRSPPQPELIFAAMQDRVHQPYRKNLVPGLPHVLASMTPSTQPGVLGICLSGAGPTILALATHNYDEIATEIIKVFNSQRISCRYLVLDINHSGAQWSETTNS